MKEIWKDVSGFDGRYQVSNLGNVRNKKREILKPQPRRHGYLSVWLYGNGVRSKRGGKQYSVHRVVADAFCPNPNKLSEVNHINENKTDNRACNLEWCTHKQNSNHGTRTERVSKSNRESTKRKRTKIAQYTLDGVLVRVFPSITSLRDSGFFPGNAYKCAKGYKAYSHSQGYIWRFVEE